MKEVAYKVLRNRPHLPLVYQTSDGTVFLDKSFANIHAKVLGTAVQEVLRSDMDKVSVDEPTPTKPNSNKSSKTKA